MEVKSGQCLVAELYVISGEVLDNIWRSLIISIGRYVFWLGWCRGSEYFTAL